MRHVLVAIVQDEPGLLARMASLFARRGYNVESFTAGSAEVPGLTRVTIVADGPGTAFDQIAKQFRKTIGVVKVADLTNDTDYMAHEMLLVKVRVTARSRPEVVSLADLFKARIVDVSNSTLVLQATGEPDKLDALLDVLKRFGIREQARSGVMAMSRGSKVLGIRPGIELGRVTTPVVAEEEESEAPQEDDMP